MDFASSLMSSSKLSDDVAVTAAKAVVDAVAANHSSSEEITNEIK